MAYVTYWRHIQHLPALIVTHTEIYLLYWFLTIWQWSLSIFNLKLWAEMKNSLHQCTWQRQRHIIVICTLDNTNATLIKFINYKYNNSKYCNLLSLVSDLWNSNCSSKFKSLSALQKAFTDQLIVDAHWHQRNRWWICEIQTNL